ncbi:BamA/TamA family outer membrane protein [Pseudomonas sp. EL_65y_Pfl2_R95]|uniref:BamA/TamA family outer membrane protein n=1 Tax=Pseudomonas sp. EL_65y_Pfl2_R95 TaxID=3088698 RepID=UPI0030DA0CD6
MSLKPILSSLALLLPSIALADAMNEHMVDPDDGQFDMSGYLSKVPSGFLPVPSLITEPAVGTGLALGALFFHESDEQRKQRTQGKALLPENISILGGAATENGTWAAAVGHLGFWLQDTVRYRGVLAYASPNLEFYSLPRTGELSKSVELNLKGPVVFQDLKYRLPGTKVFIGGRQLYRKVTSKLTHSPDLSRFPTAVQDFLQRQTDRSITTSGLGLVLEYDSRDNPFNPQKGYYYSSNYTVFDDSIGSDVDYASYQISGLNYWQLNDRWNLGLRLQMDAVNARGDKNLPPYVPPFIDLRGVPKSRYQGNRVGMAEVQLDYKLTPRWTLGAFTGTGRAADHVDQLGSAEVVNSYGTGFRYLITKRYGLVMGADIARGPEDTAVYIQTGSTW